MKQIQHPFDPINDVSNEVIRWRLFFPLIAHVLSFPNFLYLMLPHIGCIAVLAWMAKTVFDKTQSRPVAFFAMLLFGASSWFFVSCGWLAYFDSWYVLGLLVVAFQPNRAWLIVSCLLVPWIDERLVLALPLALAVRTIYFERTFFPIPRPLLLDAVAILITTVPWIAFRLYLLSITKSDTFTTIILQNPLSQPEYLWKILDGWWNGLRLIWVYAIVFYVLAMYRHKKILSSVIVSATVLLTLTLNLYLAGDISRSVSNILPFAMLGFFESMRVPSEGWKRLLYGLAIANLILPASHVVSKFRENIFYLPYEMVLYTIPPEEVDAYAYNKKGVEAWARKDGETAARMFLAANRLDPTFAEPYLNRGIIAAQQNRLADAEVDVRKALELNPNLYNAQFELSQLLLLKGDERGATILLQRILVNSPADFIRRHDAERLLMELRK